MKRVIFLALISLVACSNVQSQQAPSRNQTPSTPGVIVTGNWKRVLWQDPGQIGQRDTYWGAGSQERAPKPPFKFLEENKSGASLKLSVTDATGQKWAVKLGGEAHAEVAANRLLWTFGYLTQEMYYLHNGKFEGLQKLQRRNAEKLVAPDGTFHTARFKRSDKSRDEFGGWELSWNPFQGTREMSGLIILMALVNNWDTDSTKNQTVWIQTLPNGKDTELHYLVEDLGASFGRWRGLGQPPIKWQLSEYVMEPMVKSTGPNGIELNYGAYGDPPKVIPLEHARWFQEKLDQLSEEQIRKIFEAAGAQPAQIDGYTKKMLEKIGELRNAVNGSSTR